MIKSNGVLATQEEKEIFLILELDCVRFHRMATKCKVKMEGKKCKEEDYYLSTLQSKF